MSDMSSETGIPLPRPVAPFRRAVLSGMGIVMPPLLTLVLFIWAWNTIDDYVLAPVERLARNTIIVRVTDVFDKMPSDVRPGDQRAKDGRVVEFEYLGQSYVPLLQGQWVNKEQFEDYLRMKGRYEAVPSNAQLFYERYVSLRYLARWQVIPLFLAAFILVLYVLGKVMAFSFGRVLWLSIENLVNRLPVIRNVYSSVKQVTELLFGHHKELTYSRVVAVEYPRAGVWALAFVTGEGFADLRAVCGEPVLALLIPTSPMPATGFAVIVRKSETIDLNITIDQAFQFIVSCGVVAPHYSWPVDSQDSSRPQALSPPGNQTPQNDPAARPAVHSSHDRKGRA